MSKHVDYIYHVATRGRERARAPFCKIAIISAVGWILGLSATAAQAGGYLWFSSEISSPVKIHRYNIASGMIDLSVVPTDPSNGQLLCEAAGVCNNLAIDGTFMYLGTDGSDLFAKADAITGIVTSVGSYSPPVASSDIFEGGAYHAETGTLWRNMTNGHLLQTTTDGVVLAERVVSNAGFHLLGLEWIGQTLYASILHDKKFGTIDDPFGNPAFTEIPLSGITATHKWDGLAYDTEDNVLYMTTRSENPTAFLWTIDLDASVATLVADLTTVGYPTGAVADAVGWISAPAGCGDCPADFDGDGDVDAADLAVLLGSWGPCEP